MAPLVVESGIWLAVVMIVAASRFVSRYMTRGFKPQSDDVAMAIALCFYITFLVTINIVAKTSSNLFPEGFDLSSLTEADIQERVHGSKLILVLENCQNATIWLAKVCLLILYLRLTTLRWQNIAIKILLGYVIGSFFIMVILYLGVWCRPFSQYWAVPPNSSQCNAATNHLITNACFNLTSDVIMLAVGLPIFLRMKLPWRKKIPLVGLFSLGIFVVLAAILNKVYSFSQPFGLDWTYWYVRESSTALLVANLPFVWGLWRKMAGFKTSVAGSDENNPTAIYTSDETKQRNNSIPLSRHNPTEFITDYPLHYYEDKDDLELEGDFRRAGRSMTLAEFLIDDANDRTAQRRKSSAKQGEGRTSSPLGQNAVLHESPTREPIRRTSDDQEEQHPAPHSTRSTPASSSIPASVDGSWHASSFV
ncbi:hypothetical protein Slin14017_G020000 [Septoria linicola]|nr:hypothetical protein Slin14017_G020000 [Septoria linicola]